MMRLTAKAQHFTRARTLMIPQTRLFITKLNRKFQATPALARFSTSHVLLYLRYKSSVPINDYDEDVKTKIIPFLLADIGEGIAEVEVLQWFVAPGDTVKQFDRICEVQSDKATVEITSRYDGIVDSIAQEEVIKVGTPLIYLRVDDEEGDNHAEDDAHMHNVDEEQDKLHIPTLPSSFSVPSEVQGDSQLRTQAKVLATPAVRKMSMDYGLDLRNIVGSGPKGRVLKADVLQLLRGSGRIEKEKPEQPSTNFPVSSTLQDETVPIRGYNRLMVKSMTESLSIPHMCYADEINMNQVLAARKALPDKKISVFPFCIKAASLAIRDYPIINSSLNLEEMTVTYKARHNIGVAMDTPRGLAVPVVHNCQDLSILDIADELDRLKEAALQGNLSESDIAGATFTLSNIGAIGGTYMSPIVSSPQVAIGAMGKIQRLPRFAEKDSMQVEEVNLMQISWGGDHRVIDGATLARFSNRWKELVENPMSMLFSLK